MDSMSKFPEKEGYLVCVMSCNILIPIVKEHCQEGCGEILH